LIDTLTFLYLVKTQDRIRNLSKDFINLTLCPVCGWETSSGYHSNRSVGLCKFVTKKTKRLLSLVQEGYAIIDIDNKILSPINREQIYQYSAVLFPFLEWENGLALVRREVWEYIFLASIYSSKEFHAQFKEYRISMMKSLVEAKNFIELCQMLEEG